MKKYEIRYYFDKENYITRSVEEEENYDTDFVLNEYTKGNFQTFPDGRGNLSRVNMANVTYVKIWESNRP